MRKIFLLLALLLPCTVFAQSVSVIGVKKAEFNNYKTTIEGCTAYLQQQITVIESTSSAAVDVVARSTGTDLYTKSYANTADIEAVALSTKAVIDNYNTLESTATDLYTKSYSNTYDISQRLPLSGGTVTYIIVTTTITADHVETRTMHVSSYAYTVVRSTIIQIDSIDSYNAATIAVLKSFDMQGNSIYNVELSSAYKWNQTVDDVVAIALSTKAITDNYNTLESTATDLYTTSYANTADIAAIALSTKAVIDNYNTLESTATDLYTKANTNAADIAVQKSSTTDLYSKSYSNTAAVASVALSTKAVIDNYNTLESTATDLYSRQYSTDKSTANLQGQIDGIVQSTGSVDSVARAAIADVALSTKAIIDNYNTLESTATDLYSKSYTNATNISNNYNTLESTATDLYSKSYTNSTNITNNYNTLESTATDLYSKSYANTTAIASVAASTKAITDNYTTLESSVTDLYSKSYTNATNITNNYNTLESTATDLYTKSYTNAANITNNYNTLESTATDLYTKSYTNSTNITNNYNTLESTATDLYTKSYANTAAIATLALSTKAVTDNYTTLESSVTDLYSKSYTNASDIAAVAASTGAFTVQGSSITDLYTKALTNAEDISVQKSSTTDLYTKANNNAVNIAAVAASTGAFTVQASSITDLYTKALTNTADIAVQKSSTTDLYTKANNNAADISVLKSTATDLYSKSYTNSSNISSVAASTKAVTTMDRPLSPGRESRIAIIDNNDGTVSVSSGTGFARATNSELDTLIYFTWTANASVSLTDNALNYVYVNYNGGSPTISATTTIDTASNKFPVAVIFRYDNNVDISVAGEYLPNHFLNDWGRLASRGIERMSGATITSSGSLSLAATAGVYYLGVNQINTNPTNTITTPIKLYRTTVSSWTWVITSTIPGGTGNPYYDNGNGTLSQVGVGNFGIFHIYECLEGDLYAVYGRGNYGSIANALAAAIPTPPPYLQSFGKISAAVIVQRNGTTFSNISNVTQQIIQNTAVGIHNDLGGLQGGTAGDYNHLTTAQVGYVDSVPAVAASTEQFTVQGSSITDLYTKANTNASDISVLKSTATDLYSKSYTNAANIASVMSSTSQFTVQGSSITDLYTKSYANTADIAAVALSTKAVIDNYNTLESTATDLYSKALTNASDIAVQKSSTTDLYTKANNNAVSIAAVALSTKAVIDNYNTLESTATDLYSKSYSNTAAISAVALSTKAVIDNYNTLESSITDLYNGIPDGVARSSCTDLYTKSYSNTAAIAAVALSTKAVIDNYNILESTVTDLYSKALTNASDIAAVAASTGAFTVQGSSITDLYTKALTNAADISVQKSSTTDLYTKANNNAVAIAAVAASTGQFTVQGSSITDLYNGIPDSVARSSCTDLYTKSYTNATDIAAVALSTKAVIDNYNILESTVTDLYTKSNNNTVAIAAVALSTKAVIDNYNTLESTATDLYSKALTNASDIAVQKSSTTDLYTKSYSNTAAIAAVALSTKAVIDNYNTLESTATDLYSKSYSNTAAISSVALSTKAVIDNYNTLESSVTDLYTKDGVNAADIAVQKSTATDLYTKSYANTAAIAAVALSTSNVVTYDGVAKKSISYTSGTVSEDFSVGVSTFIIKQGRFGFGVNPSATYGLLDLLYGTPGVPQKTIWAFRSSDDISADEMSFDFYTNTNRKMARISAYEDDYVGGNGGWKFYVGVGNNFVNVLDLKSDLSTTFYGRVYGPTGEFVQYATSPTLSGLTVNGGIAFGGPFYDLRNPPDNYSIRYSTGFITLRISSFPAVGDYDYQPCGSIITLSCIKVICLSKPTGGNVVFGAKDDHGNSLINGTLQMAADTNFAVATSSAVIARDSMIIITCDSITATSPGSDYGFVLYGYKKRGQ